MLTRWTAAFWTVYLLTPIFTGLLAYDWLPNESFDPRIHEAISYEDGFEDETGKRYFRAYVWRDKATGRVYRVRDFEQHRTSEAERMAAMSFLYGLDGCFWYALTERERGKGFYSAFRKAIMVNLAIVTWTYLR